MATGTVKWFNPTKGFGFIQPEARRNKVLTDLKAGVGDLSISRSSPSDSTLNSRTRARSASRSSSDTVVPPSRRASPRT